MNKAAIIVLADTETHGELSRVSLALVAVKEFKDANFDVKMIFEGAGTKWIGKLSDTENKMHHLYEKVKDKIGVCSFCSKSYGTNEIAIKEGLPLLEEYKGHASIKKLVTEDYEIVVY